jgi:anti-sigma regulatory factor (Ser/Thr protein kinase)
MGSLFGRPSARAAVLVGVWTLVAFFFAGQYYVAVLQMGRSISFWAALRPQLVCWFLWALAAPYAFRLAWRYPIERGHWVPRILLHALASVVFSCLHNLAETAVLLSLGVFEKNPPFLRAFESIMVRKLHLDVFTYLVILGVAHAVHYGRRERERELRASRLEARLAHAELQVLRTQLHPHFLFNTLHAISALMHKDVETADQMMTRLGDLLRLTLDRAGHPEVSLREELEFLDRYLEIQRTRFGDRLVVRVSIDPATLDARVPHLILQPLVENAIQHGIAPRRGAGRIDIRAQKVNETLELEVVDNGAGPPEGVAPMPEGLGLTNTRARLAQLYGSAHRFDIRRSESGGVAVTLGIPLRISEEEVLYGDPVHE